MTDDEINELMAKDPDAYAKSRTCRKCWHFRPRDPNNGLFGDVCNCPIPPWAEHSDNVLRVRNTSMFAQSCPCYSPKEPTP